jgi:D-psicose/D-tagatose/L-ribulose 3-epimerase
MKFGINTFLFASPFTNRSTRLFRKFKAWGFDGVEIAVENPKDIDPIFVKAQLEQHGLVCSSICACLGGGRDLRGTPEQQQNAYLYLEQLIDQAVVLGCPSVIGPVYSEVGRADAVPAAEYRKQWATVVKHLTALAKYAGKKGVTICLEPLNRFESDFINTCDQGLKLIQAVGQPALKLHLDTFHMNIEEKNLGDAIRRAGRQLGHIHASASDRGTPGNDHVDWPGVARALQDINYQGAVVIESFTQDVKVIARAAAIWRKIEPNRNDIASKGIVFLKKTFK